MTTDIDRESYLRWQEFAITQLGYTINLFLTLAGATLGFALKILMESPSAFSGLDRCLFLASFPLIGLSIASALAANTARAVDFRSTRRAARARMKDGKDHDDLHGKAECFGKWTWRFFYFQTVSFGLGVLTFSVSIGLAYVSRI